MKPRGGSNLLERPEAEGLFLFLACFAALCYRAWPMFKTIAGGIPPFGYTSYDGVYYTQIARNILHGDGLGWEAMIFPVLQPIMVSIASRITGIANLQFLSSTVSQAAGVLMLAPLYLLTRDIFGRNAAVAAVLIAIPYPHLVAIGGGDTTESLYSFMVVLSIYLGYKALSRPGMLNLFIAGASLGLTYLARPEGLIIFAMFFLLAVWRLWRLRAGKNLYKNAAMLAAGFLIFALPYMVFLTRSYGRVVISSKLPYESIAMRSKVLGYPLYAENIEGLTGDLRLVWQEKGGSGMVLRYFRENPSRFVRVYFRDFVSELPWKVGNSSQLEGYPPVYPTIICIFAAIGFIVILFRGNERWVAFLIWGPFANFFVYAVFTRGFWMYHVPYVPLLILLAAGGAAGAVSLVVRNREAALLVLVLLAAAWDFYAVRVRFDSRPQTVRVVQIKGAINEESLKAGIWGRTNIGTNVTYMMPWSRLVSYLGGRWVFLPWGNPWMAVAYGRKEGADYIVEEIIGRDNSESQSRFAGVPGLTCVYTYSSMDIPYSVIFWKLNKSVPGISTVRQKTSPQDPRNPRL